MDGGKWDVVSPGRESCLAPARPKISEQSAAERGIEEVEEEVGGYRLHHLFICFFLHK